LRKEAAQGTEEMKKATEEIKEPTTRDTRKEATEEIKELTTKETSKEATKETSEAKMKIKREGPINQSNLVASLMIAIFGGMIVNTNYRL